MVDEGMIEGGGRGGRGGKQARSGECSISLLYSCTRSTRLALGRSKPSSSIARAVLSGSKYFFRDRRHHHHPSASAQPRSLCCCCPLPLAISQSPTDSSTSITHAGLAERDASDCRAHSVNFRLQNTDPEPITMSNLLKRLGKLLPLGRNKPVGYDLDGTFLTGRRDMVP